MPPPNATKAPAANPVAPIPAAPTAPIPAPPQAPVVPVPAPQSAQQMMFDAAMRNVVVDIGAEGTDPLSNARPANLPPNVAWNPPQPRPEVAQPVAPMNPHDDPATLSYRSMLNDEERRLQQLRARNPMPPIPEIAPLPYSHLGGVQQRTLTIKEGVDPLLVEAYQTLSTLVAGGLIAPSYDKSKVLAVLQKLERAVEYVPAASVSPVAAVSTEPEKKS